MFSLILPPDYGTDFPPLGTPALTGFLKSKGVSVSQLDLNIAYLDWWIRRAPGVPVRQAMNEHFGKSGHPLLPRGEDLPYDNRTNSSFHFTERMLSNEALFGYLEDREQNTFLQFYEESALPDGDIVGLSLISPSQVLAALTLCRLLKRRAPKTRIVLGGQWVSLYAEAVMARADWTPLVDAFIVGEGETPLLEWLKGGDPAQVPNLVYQREGRWVRSVRSSEEDLDALPAPDFDGLPLESYDSRGTLTYETARGCYWNKCVYCVDLPIPKPSWREKKAGLVVRDMGELSRCYKTESLMISNAAISPRQMREISELLVQDGTGIRWWTMARLDAAFTREVFDLAKRAGCWQINFGFESANDRVCDFVQKGNRRETSLKVIGDCHAAGIKVCLQTMLGLPSETVEEGLDTVQFLLENRALIGDAAINVYYLTPKCRVYEEPASFGIEAKKDSCLPFQFFTEFRQIRGGMDRAEAQGLWQLYQGLRRRPKVELMEDHNEALAAWRKAGVKDRVLVHLDAHIDFGWVPDKDIAEVLEAKTKAELDALLAAKPLWNPTAMKKQQLVTIGNYICPAMREGIVREFWWVVPDASFRDEREELVRQLERLTKEPVEAGPDVIKTKVDGKTVAVCALAGLPALDEEVLLDIDVDYLVTPSILDDLSPGREPWVFPRELKDRLAVRTDFVTLSYSVKGGFTPMRWRHLGDELKALFLGEDYREPLAAERYRRARKALDEGRLDEARAAFRDAVSADPGYRTIYHNAGPVHEQAERWAEAEAAYRETLSLEDPVMTPQAFCGLGNCALGRKEWLEAEGCFMKADAHLAEARLGLGLARFEQGRLEDAEAALKRAVELDPAIPQAYHRLGLIRSRSGDAEGARGWWRKARRYGSDDEEVRSAGAGRGRLLSGRVEDETVLVDEDAAVVWRLNELGGFIWKALEGKRSVEEVVGLVAKEFDAPEAEVRRDVLAFVEEMGERGLLR